MKRILAACDRLGHRLHSWRWWFAAGWFLAFPIWLLDFVMFHQLKLMPSLGWLGPAILYVTFGYWLTILPWSFVGCAVSFGFGPGPTWRTCRPGAGTHPALAMVMDLFRLYIAFILLIFALTPFIVGVFYLAAS